MLILAWIIFIGIILAVVLAWSAIVSENEWWEAALALLIAVVFIAFVFGIGCLFLWSLGIIITGGAGIEAK